MEVNGLKSIWDGWEYQAFGTFVDAAGVGQCARGYILGATRDESGFCVFRKPVELWSVEEEENNPEVRAAYRRVATWLREHRMVPPDYFACGASYVVYANNYLKLPPAEFRRIDIEMQIRETVQPLVESVQIEEVLAIAGAEVEEVLA